MHGIIDTYTTWIILTSDIHPFIITQWWSPCHQSCLGSQIWPFLHTLQVPHLLKKKYVFYILSVN